ncbi:hypothetical protein SME41J_47960 (plasmid) [Serratia marcescens]|nr:hypothetical protein SME41J_47960 [Serratia marcescens]
MLRHQMNRQRAGVDTALSVDDCERCTPEKVDAIAT